MQMRRMYESTNHRKRAAQLRREAKQDAKAGFMIFADIAWDLANWLNPPVEPRKTRDRR